MKRGNKRKFGRVRKTRKALYKALATALIDNGKIKTTTAKAKSLSAYMDKIITKAKKDDVASRRLIRRDLGEKANNKLFKEIAPKFKDSMGGYTKVFKIGRRLSDGSEMAIIQFTK